MRWVWSNSWDQIWRWLRLSPQMDTISSEIYSWRWCERNCQQNYSINHLNRISEPPSIGWNIEVSKENMHNWRTPLLGIELFQNWTIRSKLKKEHLIYPLCHIDFKIIKEFEKFLSLKHFRILPFQSLCELFEIYILYGIPISLKNRK